MGGVVGRRVPSGVESRWSFDDAGHVTGLALHALPPAPDRRPPRWAVPALSTMLVLSLAGAATVLVTTPAPGVADADVVSSVVPVLGHLVGPGR